MQSFAYLFLLLASLGCLLLIDYRFKLAFFVEMKRSLLTIGSGIGLFIIWDLLGIASGIFFSGGSSFALSFMIVPEFPLEEIFFLFLLSYVALLLYLGAKKLWPKRI